MNLVGFFRDVNPEVYATFVDKKSEKRRKAAYKDFKKYWLAKAEEILGGPGRRRSAGRCQRAVDGGHPAGMARVQGGVGA